MKADRPVEKGRLFATNTAMSYCIIRSRLSRAKQARQQARSSSSAPASFWGSSSATGSFLHNCSCTCKEASSVSAFEQRRPETDVANKYGPTKQVRLIRLAKAISPACHKMIGCQPSLEQPIGSRNSRAARKSCTSQQEPLHLLLCGAAGAGSGKWKWHPVSWLLLVAALLALALIGEAQYRPEWPSKALQQEIFLLNLEDGYFGCQVNESQDFLQLFELSRLCDGQTQCYLGTDELASPLKCNTRDRCSVHTNSRGQSESIECVHGVCLDGLCYCNDGFGGKSCDIPDENECKFRPCDVFAHCTNTMGSYYCSCFPGYDGDGMHCQDINECEIPSLAALCQDNSECCNLPGHFVCKCKPGYQQAGQTQSLLSGAPSGNTSVSCTDIDECADERACGKGAVCQNLPGSFRCSCPAGFTGDPLSECIDMDECRSSPCGLGAQCTNVPGGFTCTCAPGWEPAGPRSLIGANSSGLNGSETACLDVDECARPGACGQGAQCVNTPGAHFCQCPPNFTGNPKLACLDIDECAAFSCGPNAACTNLPGSYQCRCRPGYTGDAYSQQGCQDEDECASAAPACGENALCFNRPGGFECACAPGFTGDARLRCQDLDECALGGAVCGPGAQCVNLAGSYKCVCPHKFAARAAPELGCQRAAVDVACAQEQECTANALCVQGACQCRLGFRAHQSECVDVDECAGAAANASSGLNEALCGPSAVCVNEPGGFRCECLAGYERPAQPAGAHARCQDVDECAGGGRPCGPNARCFNTPGAYTCACADGFVPVQPGEPALGCKSPCDGVHCGPHATCRPHGEEAACVCKPGFTFEPANISAGCLDIDECDPRLGPSGLCGQRALCTNLAGSYRCHCPAGYSGDARKYCEDVNECDRRFGVFGQCGQQAVCTNRPGGFECACAPGYSGDPRVRCHDVDECAAGAAACGPGALCSNTAGGFQCACPAGHAGDPSDPHGAGCRPEAPACAPDGPHACPGQLECRAGRCECPFGEAAGAECRHPCQGVQCGPNASCQLDGQLAALCVCQAGFWAPQEPQAGRADAPGCLDVNECLQGATPLTSGLAAGALAANGSHPCGRNALCRNHPGSFDCVCPPGFAGDPYASCHQAAPDASASSATVGPNQALPTTYGAQQQLSNYQQEARTGACAHGCLRGQVCSDGHCVQPDACRDAHDCRSHQTCQLVSHALGRQCVNACEPRSCGPNASCSPINHKPVCACNSSASLAGDPYDLLRGCQPVRIEQLEQHEMARTSGPAASLELNRTLASSPAPEQLVERQTKRPTAYESTSTPSGAGKRKEQQPPKEEPSRVLACTSDQHCPGNLLCLGRSCACPAGHRREADLCFMQRLNCSSAAHCRPREECLTVNSQHFNLMGPTDDWTNGICICPRGFKLTQSGSVCLDRNECDEGTPCAVGAVCQNKLGSYECVCPPGTQGEPYTKTCEPIAQPPNQCSTSSDCPSDKECDLVSHRCVSPCYVCGPRAICTAANHVAICLCPPRYTGNAIDLVYGCQEPLATTTILSPTTTTTTATKTTTTLFTESAEPANLISSSTSTSGPIGTTMANLASTNSPIISSTGQPLNPNTSLRPAASQSSATGVPVTVLLPTTTIAPIESTTPELVEFRTIPPSELFVMCLADGIQVEVQLGGFDGIIYVKGHSQDPKCRKLVMSSNANEFVDFKVQFGHCDLIHRDGEAGFVLVIQKHPKLVTYRARAYHVKCVYNTGERTVTLGFNVSMITTSGTIANTGPPPTCLMSIASLDGHEVTSAEIGQDLLLRVDVQPDSIYGGFARSCEAKTMDDEGEYQYEVTDANGCATDPSIFSDWKYDQHRKSLVARFNAFKFPSSNNLRFQCNIRVCFGSCPPVNCNGIDAYGRKRKRREAPALGLDSSSAISARSGIKGNEDGDDDDSDATDELLVTEAFKEGALREEVMVQSNAILTFDRKEASLPQQSSGADDIEFVCLPRLGILMSIVLTTLLALLALAIATSCWCFTKRKRQLQCRRGPLPHPVNFPNPLLHSPSASSMREPIYGP